MKNYAGSQLIRNFTKCKLRMRNHGGFKSIDNFERNASVETLRMHNKHNLVDAYVLKIREAMNENHSIC